MHKTMEVRWKWSVKHIVFVLFLHVSITWCFHDENCPVNCICISRNAGTPSLYCDGINLKAIPRTLDRDTEYISLRLNRIKNITADDFVGMNEIRELHLDFNWIETISEDAFYHMPRLRSLYLGHNRINYIHPNTFSRLHALEELYINDNALTNLDESIFQRLPKLRLLFVQSNQISQAPNVFANLPSLVFLNLAHNRLPSVGYGMFRNSKRLSILYLHDNRIATINSNAFDTLKQITEVRLHSNQLTSFNQDVLKHKLKLSRISIYENPLHCDCNLYWMINVIRAGWILFQHRNKIKCRYPDRLRDKAVVELNRGAFQCYGAWTDWGVWGECTRPCGSGTRRRKRLCETNARADVTASCRGPGEQTDSCNTFKCSRGLVTNWSQWSKCTHTCNQGTRKRVRTCVDPNHQNAVAPNACEENLVDHEPCMERKCPVDGGWSHWGIWSDCKKFRTKQKCGNGIKRRKRTCTNPAPSFGGSLCNGGLREIYQNKVCVVSLCPSQTSWSKWSDWSECSVTCGEGHVMRTRTCRNEYDRVVHSKSCSGKNIGFEKCTKQSGLCNSIGGGLSEWSAWSKCDLLTCQRHRTRKCNDGGTKCDGKTREEKSCENIDHCIPKWGEWLEWSTCSKSCNTGVQTRRRSCRKGNGKDGVKTQACTEENQQKRDCNTNACPAPITVWSAWGKWGSCDKFTGKQTRKRKCGDDASTKARRCKGKDKEKRMCKNANYKCKPRGTISNGFEVTSRVNSTVLAAAYTCKPFYKLKGPSSATCTDGVGWSSPKTPYCVPVCGKRRKEGEHWSQRARIYGGVSARPNSWPWQVAIEVKSREKGWILRCGGSLINDRWIATAGHCLYDSSPTTRLFKAKEIKIFLGVNDVTKRATDPRVQRFQAKETLPHPKFDYQSLNNDIGLIQLDRVATLSVTVCPVCVPSPKQKRLLKSGREGIVVGWGTTLLGNASSTLRELTLPVVSRKRCMSAYDDQYNVTESMFCAGRRRERNQDTCKGDSGGGFVMKDPRRGKWTLQGIVSWGDKSCGRADKYSVYTRVVNFSHWIRRTMRGRALDARRGLGRTS